MAVRQIAQVTGYIFKVLTPKHLYQTPRKNGVSKKRIHFRKLTAGGTNMMLFFGRQENSGFIF